MKPVELAALVYTTEPCARSFREDLEAHLLNGYVVSTPSSFTMGRAVRRDATYEEIVNPWVNFDAPDCWHLYLFSGAMIEAFSAAPYPLPWVSFERKNKLRFFKWDDIWAACSRYNSSHQRCADT